MKPRTPFSPVGSMEDVLEIIFSGICTRHSGRVVDGVQLLFNE